MSSLIFGNDGYVDIFPHLPGETSMNIYTGQFTNEDWYQIQKNGMEFSPKRSFEYVNHSPDGFSWGYCGSGPAQLAFAILLEETNSSYTTKRLYQQFKEQIIAALPQQGNWKLTSDEIQSWIESHEG